MLREQPNQKENSYLIEIKGLVQGVGFRPFIYRLANELKLNGSVENRNDGVHIYINGNPTQTEEFVSLIKQTKEPKDSQSR